MTKIEWTDETWNPTTGCNDDVVSPGCEHCYARRMSRRLAGRYGYPRDEPFRVTTHPDRLDLPLRWRKPRRVFVDSMGDLFHEDVPDEFISAVFGVMAACPQHTFMVLTKRPERMAEWFKWAASPASRAIGERWQLATWGWCRTSPARPPSTWHLCSMHAAQRTDGLGYSPLDKEGLWPLPNVWLGVTAEDQQRADERWGTLRRIPAAVHWISGEPLLSHIWMNHWTELPDWIVVGAETGPGARPMQLEWARRIFAKSRASGIPFFFKKAGPGIATPPDLAVREWPEVGR